MKQQNLLLFILVGFLWLLTFPSLVYGQTPSMNLTGPTAIRFDRATFTSGIINSNGGGNITSKGVCWGTAHAPTIDENNFTANGTGTGGFTVTITGLSPGVTYYVRAYAVNDNGPGYSIEISVTTTATAPEVTTLQVTGIASTSAGGSGNVDSEGGKPVTARGVCWSTASTPTISYPHTIDGTGRGSFASQITGLQPGTSYYVRAYATNEIGTSHGDTVNFTTLTTPALPIVTTDAVSEITVQSAVCGGHVKDQGEAYVTARGVCWSTTSPPSLDDYFTSDGTGEGRFTSSITGLIAGETYYVRAYATNANGTSYGKKKEFIAADYDPFIRTSRYKLYYKSVTSGRVTLNQQFFIIDGNNISTGVLAWNISSNASWLRVSPISGTGDGRVTVSVDSDGLTTGENIGVLTITARGASNSPLEVPVYLEVADTGEDLPPLGSFDTPLDGSTVSGSIPVTGWAIDDVGIKHVKIYRDDNMNDKIYIGDAVFVEGARPDIETTYDGYPNHSAAGWGYMLLTNTLPNGGGGTYTLYGEITDLAGQTLMLESKTITCDNENSVLPFGAIDTPLQGGSASGVYVNWGWALTPNPNMISPGGSDIRVMVDGTLQGYATYGQYRQDIAGIFPGYINSNGAGAYFVLNTTPFASGVYTISWLVKDSAGNTGGIGSRYFTIFNEGANRRRSAASASHSTHVFTHDSPHDSPITPFSIYRGWNPVKLAPPKTFDPDGNAVYHIRIRELEPLVIHLGKAPHISTYLQKHALPPGAMLDPRSNTFRWLPGPGCHGRYRLVLGDQNRFEITVNPKFPSTKIQFKKGIK